MGTLGIKKMEVIKIRFVWFSLIVLKYVIFELTSLIKINLPILANPEKKNSNLTNYGLDVLKSQQLQHH